MCNYWCYRIDTSKIDFFQNELEKNILRQGWGWDERQNLRNLSMDEGAKRNLPMFNKVKKDDILLIPRLPVWGEVAIAEATEDWDIGYEFGIHEKLHDYGHKFPVKMIKRFTRKNENVTGNIRSTLKNPSRFWNINHYSDDVEKLLASGDLLESQSHEDRFISTIGSTFNAVFDDHRFKNEIYEKIEEQFSREDWEYALVTGLRELFPFYTVERVGGKEEKYHGTDILIKLPSLISGYEYGIAIQVKDYDGLVHEDVIKQINKAEAYWTGNDNLKLIEKIVIVTRSQKDDNEGLLNNESNVKIIFAGELKDLLHKIARSYIGIEND